jgi:pyruvate/2-oxoglutarate dehydrogenase complex dihydrolipoamide dehydrogenase (E3) component
MDSNHYDLVVIGSGPAGQKAAITAASGKESLSSIVRSDGRPEKR